MVEADTAAEGLRSVFHLITWTHEQGGAGITAGIGQWENVTASFPPHSPTANAKLLRGFAGKPILNAEDLDDIRAQFGERVAFYYAFIQSYSLFLVLPAGLGLLAWYFLRAYSTLFATVISIWSIVFAGYWRRQETDFAVRWDVRGVGALKQNRPQYWWDEEVIDPTTGEKQKKFSPVKRVRRQMLFLPFAALAGIALGTVLIATFALEAWMNDIYDGGLKEHWIGSKGRHTATQETQSHRLRANYFYRCSHSYRRSFCLSLYHSSPLSWKSWPRNSQIMRITGLQTSTSSRKCKSHSYSTSSLRFCQSF